MDDVVFGSSNGTLKNAAEAQRHKDKGNVLFGKGQYDEAVLLYTKVCPRLTVKRAVFDVVQAFAWSPPTDELYCVALANRSAALFNMCQFLPAWEDTERCAALPQSV